jgi:hypothetical protein
MVPVSDQKACYSNLLIPVLERQAISGNKTIDGVDYTYMGIGTLTGTDKQGFVTINGTPEYGPNRCLLQVPTEYVTTSSARSMDYIDYLLPVTVDAELAGETSSMHNIPFTTRNEAGAQIYNLNGQQMSKPGKGLNIINGRKVVVR